jgi:hypothetical protein
MPTDTPTRTTLENAPARALTFLAAISRRPEIFGLMQAAGYTAADQGEGWKLLHKASGYAADKPLDTTHTAANDAMLELDAWDEDGFRRIDAPLRRLHPEQHAFVFQGGLAPSVGPAAVVGVRLLLDRLDALESLPARAATREADHAALATLTKRRMTRDERDRLRALVKTAEDVEEPTSPLAAVDDEAREAALVALYAWLHDWTNTARSVVKKRIHLISLGLAKRKHASDDDGEDTPVEPPLPAQK